MSNKKPRRKSPTKDHGDQILPKPVTFVQNDATLTLPPHQLAGPNDTVTDELLLINHNKTINQQMMQNPNRAQQNSLAYPNQHHQQQSLLHPQHNYMGQTSILGETARDNAASPLSGPFNVTTKMDQPKQVEIKTEIKATINQSPLQQISPMAILAQSKNNHVNQQQMHGVPQGNKHLVVGNQNGKYQPQRFPPQELSHGSNQMMTPQGLQQQQSTKGPMMALPNSASRNFLTKERHSLPPVSQRALAPNHMKLSQPPMLAPVGSLSNLMSLISSESSKNVLQTPLSHRQANNTTSQHQQQQMPLILQNQEQSLKRLGYSNNKNSIGSARRQSEDVHVYPTQVEQSIEENFKFAIKHPPLKDINSNEYRLAKEYLDIQRKYNTGTYQTKSPKRLIDPYLRDPSIRDKLKQVTYNAIWQELQLASANDAVMPQFENTQSQTSLQRKKEPTAQVKKAIEEKRRSEIRDRLVETEMKSMILRNASSYISASEATFGVNEIYKQAIEALESDKQAQPAIGRVNNIKGEHSQAHLMPNSSVKVVDPSKKDPVKSQINMKRLQKGSTSALVIQNNQKHQTSTSSIQPESPSLLSNKKPQELVAVREDSEQTPIEEPQSTFNNTRMKSKKNTMKSGSTFNQTSKSHQTAGSPPKKSKIYEDFKKNFQAENEAIEAKTKVVDNPFEDFEPKPDVAVVLDRDQQNEYDKQLFEKYEQKGYVSIKTLIMKTPIDRTEKEVEYLVLYMKFKHSQIFGKCDKPTIELLIQRLQLGVFTRGHVIATKNSQISKMTMLMEGQFKTYSGSFTDDGKAADLSEFSQNNTSTSYYNTKEINSGEALGNECFTQSIQYQDTWICSSKNCFTVALTKKDYEEVLHFRKMEEQTSWINFLNRSTFMQAMPYYLAQDMCKLMQSKVFKRGEVIYDVQDRTIDNLYFVHEGRVRLEAQVDIQKEQVYPIPGQHKWRVDTKTQFVSYLIRELMPLDMFGLEELYKIGMHIVAKKPYTHIVRKCRIVCAENTKVLFLTAEDFYKLFFGELELRKTIPFLEQINLSEIQQQIKLAWASKNAQGSKVVDLAKEIGAQNNVKTKNLSGWTKKSDTSSKELKKQLQRIRIVGSKTTSRIIEGLEAYKNSGLGSLDNEIIVRPITPLDGGAIESEEEYGYANSDEDLDSYADQVGEL